MTTAAQREEMQVSKGAVIFRQGDPGHEMFVISQGRVRLTIGAGGVEKEVARPGPGEFFGELSLLSDEPRSATAEAVEDSTLLVIGRDVFAMMVQDDLDIVFRMMNIQGRRLSLTNQPIQDLTQRVGHIRVVAQCLRSLLRADAQAAVAIDLGGLAKDLNLSAQAVHATVGEMVERGIGTQRDQQWTIQGRDNLEKLLDALCRYAEGS